MGPTKSKLVAEKSRENATSSGSETKLEQNAKKRGYKRTESEGGTTKLEQSRTISETSVSTKLEENSTRREHKRTVSESRITRMDQGRIVTSSSVSTKIEHSIGRSSSLSISQNQTRNTNFRRDFPSTSNGFLSFKNPPETSIGLTTSNHLNESPYSYKVKKTGKLYDNYPLLRVPVYQTHSENRGQCLVINNVKFHKETLHRAGAEKDEKDLVGVLEQIGFGVDKRRNVQHSDMKNILKNFSTNQKLKKVDICLVVVMSHGTDSNIPGGYTDVLCTDLKKISTDDIVDYFNESRCPHLKNKPKIFIFQCCRNSIQTDAVPIKLKPADKSNTLIAHCTIPGFPSSRDTQNGTWYIQTLCKVFADHAHEYHLEELLQIVDDEMKRKFKSKQIACYENRGFSRCYLHPC